MINYATLISGGVDSSVVVHLLKERGITPDLFYIKIGMDGDSDLTCTAEEDIEMAQFVAKKYGCKLEIVDLHREYWNKVVSYTIERVGRGLTPNPDVMCNRLIKFGAFDERYGGDYQRITTGHYAWRLEKENKIFLGAGIDPVKDQTDFLCQLTYEQLCKSEFPIGRLMKEEVRSIALEQRLVTATRKDSQGICFLGKINYNDFVRRFLGEREGDIIDIDTGKRLGTHKGFWFHTIGQRKGLGLAGGPWFVVKKDIDENIIYVSGGYDPELQYQNGFVMQDFTFLTPQPSLNVENEIDIRFKIRHTSEYLQGRLLTDHDGRYRVEASSPIQGVAPGQFGVIYDADAQYVLGSGEIGIP